MTRPRRTRSAGQDGTALLAVLWIALLLSVLAAGALAAARTEIRAAHARAESFKARMAAESGLDVAAYLTAVGVADDNAALSGRAPDTLNGYVLSYEDALEEEIFSSHETHRSYFSPSGKAGTFSITETPCSHLN